MLAAWRRWCDVAENKVSIDGVVDLGDTSVNPLFTYSVPSPIVTGTYVFSMADVPGVALANNYLSVFNPVGSGKTMIFGGMFFSAWNIAAITTPASMHGNRVTAASGGTLQTNSTAVAKFSTTNPTSTMEVRIANPTVTLGAQLFNYPPPVTNLGTGQVYGVTTPPGAAPFTFAPGEGIVVQTATGDTDMRWNISYVWAEL